LLALGLPMRDEDFMLSAGDVRGKRCWLRVVESEYTNSKGETSKQLKIAAEKDYGSSFGYWPEDAPPAGHTTPEDDADPMSDLPF
jgi:hypothetical protein